MPARHITVQDFGGLDLVSDPPESEGCIAGSVNFTLSKRGRVGSRTGLSRFSTSAATGTNFSMLYVTADATGADVPLQLSSSLATIYADKLTVGGVRTSIGSWAATGAMTVPARIGTPTSELAFFASYNSDLTGVTLRKWDIGGGSLGTSVGKPRFVSVWPSSNRLIQAGFFAGADIPNGLANGTLSTIAWSGPGTPEDFTTEPNNYLHLRPGDGESIRSVINWQQYTFVFKWSALFVFFGESSLADGTPDFNHYRTIPLPAKLPVIDNHDTRQLAVAGHEGVYFVTTDGVYRTQGGIPALISAAVGPLFDGSGADVDRVGKNVRLSYAGNRLYLRYLSAGLVDRTLVFDELTGQWELWGVSALAGAGSPPVFLSAVPLSSVIPVSRVLVTHDGDGDVYFYDPAAVDDHGTVVVSAYQSAWTELGPYYRGRRLGAPQSKRVREVGVWGTGAPTLSILTDRGVTDSSATTVPEATVTLGAAPQVARFLQRKARTGREFSYLLQGTAPWEVSSLEWFIADERAA